ncbi:hypothetical protein HJC23_000305 [Cyclotella cryptica]|uniref:Uncharacterized protein n=1 Tax=Cyclotella cryptica TaxID=29204 RepID=A0ABD3P3M9_9STRA
MQILMTADRSRQARQIETEDPPPKMTTLPFLPFVTNRRRLILVKDKWRVETKRSRRRELMLRQLCHAYISAGYSKSLAHAVDIGDSGSSCNDHEGSTSCLDQGRTGRHESETLTLLENLEHAIKETSGALYDVSEGEATSHVQPYRTNKPFINGNHPCSLVHHPSISINTPLLRLGSKQNTWLDFGGDTQNIIGRMHSLPVIIQAPGSSREDNPDLAINFDVEIGSSSPSSSLERKGFLYFCLDDNHTDCSTDEGYNNNSMMARFTAKEGESRVVYITWAPTNEGCLRQSIHVKTSFNGTREQIAEEEIIIVGCARKESNDMLDNVVDGGSSTHHFDLAQSPLDHQHRGREYKDSQSGFLDFDDSPELAKDAHTISQVDEEESQNDIDHINQKTGDVEQTDESKETTIHSTYPEEDGQIQNKSLMGHGAECSTTTAKKLPPLHSSMERSIAHNQKLAKLRRLRATNSLATARDRYGQRILPLRATHPLAVLNQPGLSDGAKLRGYNRHTKPQPQRQQDLSSPRQEEAIILSRQTDELPLEESKNNATLGNDEVLTIAEVANAETSLESSNVHGEVICPREVGIVETNIAADSSLEDFRKEEIQSIKYAHAEYTTEKEGVSESPKVECREVENHSGQSVEKCPPCHSDSFSRTEFQYDVGGHESNAPSNNATLQTTVKVCVEVDDAKMAALGDFSHKNDEQNENATSSLADEISDMQSFLTSVNGEVSSSMVSAVDVSSDPADDVTEAQHRTNNEAETSNGPKAFTFEESPSSQGDDESTSSCNPAHVNKSYENVTDELNELMSDEKVESTITITKRSNTPLKDLHDQINFYINAHHSVSPTKKNKELTPEPDNVVPLTLDKASLLMSSSESYTSSSIKAKRQPSITKKSLYRDDQQPNQSNRGLARKSARKLYFYKSPRNADKKRSKATRMSASNGKIENDEHKNEVENNASTLQNESSPLESGMINKDKTLDEFEVKSEEKILSQPLSKPAAKSELRKSYPLQTARTDLESNYKSRLQSIRKNRSTGSLSTAVVDMTTQNEPPRENPPSRDHSIAQQQTSARNAARKLYFFKAPSERINSPGTRASEKGKPEPMNVPDVKDTPSSQAIRAKSLVDVKSKRSPPTPALSSRELLAIEKHVQSMKKSTRKSIA